MCSRHCGFHFFLVFVIFFLSTRTASNRPPNIQINHPLNSKCVHIDPLVSPSNTEQLLKRLSVPTVTVCNRSVSQAAWCFKSCLWFFLAALRVFRPQQWQWVDPHCPPAGKIKWVVSMGRMTLLHIPPLSYKHHSHVVLLTPAAPVWLWIKEGSNIFYQQG